MQFQFDGRTFRLEFERKYKELSLERGKRIKNIRSKYPYTTAKLFVNKGEIPIATGIVGCLPSDPYSHAKGRLEALKSMTGRLRRLKDPRTKEFIQLLWEAYTNRGKVKVTVTELPASTEQKLLPAETETQAS